MLENGQEEQATYLMQGPALDSVSPNWDRCAK